MINKFQCTECATIFEDANKEEENRTLTVLDLYNAIYPLIETEDRNAKIRFNQVEVKAVDYVIKNVTGNKERYLILIGE